MRKDRDILLFLASGGMELTWLYAWATFLMTAIINRHFPLPEAGGTFLLAAALGLITRKMRLRVISVFGLQIIGFFLVALRVIYTFNYRASAYFDAGWLIELFSKDRAPQEWLILMIILILVLLFWISGTTLTRRSPAYLTIGIRFDYGVGAFVALFILKALMFIRGGVVVQDPAPIRLLFPFFIFSLLAIGLARNSDSAQRHFLAGYRGVGMLASFTAVVFVFGAGLVLLCMPYMRAAAEVVSSLLKSVAGPLLPTLELLLRFIFKGRYSHQAVPNQAVEEGPVPIAPGESSWWDDLVMQGLGGGLIGLLLLAGIILGAVGCWYLLRWLFSKPSEKPRQGVHWQTVIGWALRLWMTTGRILKGAAQQFKAYRNAVQLYGAFLRWGRHSGLPRILWETPAEYGYRLRKQFPSLNAEIGEIVDAFNLTVYGEKDPDDDQIMRARYSWKKMRSPRNWPARLKSWFLQGKK